MLLDLLQTVGTQRCHPPNPDSQSLPPSDASFFLEGPSSPRSSFNSLGKAFPGPPSLSSFLASDPFFGQPVLWGLSSSSRFLATLSLFSWTQTLFSALPVCVL